MRKIIIVTLIGGLIAIALSGCKKNSNNYAGTAGCITRIIPKADDLLMNAGDFETAKKLFQDNGLSLQTHQPVQFFTDSSTPGTYLTGIQTRHFLNGLLIVDGSESFSFSNGKLVDSSSFQENGTPEDADSTPRIALEDVRKIFLDSHPDNYSVENIVAKKKNVTHWADSCVATMLVYSEKWLYDNTQPYSSNTYLKMWIIYTESRSFFQPIAFIRDDNGQAIPEKYQLVIFP